jgi:hypothetical protein
MEAMNSRENIEPISRLGKNNEKNKQTIRKVKNKN